MKLSVRYLMGTLLLRCLLPKGSDKKENDFKQTTRINKTSQNLFRLKLYLELSTRT